MKRFLYYRFIAAIVIFQSGFLQGQQLTLTPTNYNGFNVSCFGYSNGSIDLTISGGTPPYTILWSNNQTTEDINSLPAGYYRVTVDDADTLTEPVEAEITLTEPRRLILTADPYVYPNGFNISLHDACNGSVSLTATDGVSPYAFAWSDGNLSQNRTSVCADRYDITLTDANGCTDKLLSYALTEPERSDWQMIGNQGSNPLNNFIGTTDLTDLVFKTQSVERLRITSIGEINLPSFTSSGNRYLQVNSLGNLQLSTPSVPWETRGNDNINDQVDFIGTTNSADFIIRTFDIPRVYIKASGLIGIGVQNPVKDFEVNGFSRFGDFANGFVEVGYNSTSNFVGLDSYGFVSNGLRINYFSGQDVKILTNTTGGSFEVGHNTFLSTIDGAVGIGTTNVQTGYKLLVDGGKAGFREIYVKLNGTWPDYVFSDKYSLLPIDKLELHLKLKNTLPGFPDAENIKSEGQNIGDIQRLQMEKIEELYLYIIQLNKKIEDLENKLII